MRAPRLASLALALLLPLAVVPAAAAHDTGPTGPETGAGTRSGGGLSTAEAGGPDVVYTYEVGTRGEVAADLATFAAGVEATLGDDRGWSLGGSVAFRQVSAGGDFELLLASPQAVEDAAPVCDAAYSCRVGDRVYINDDNWRRATAAYRNAGGDLATYRDYVVNHEVGHFLGFGHADCPASGRPAPVMQQQSISLHGCAPTGWPREREREELAARLGVPIRDGDEWGDPEHDWLEGDVTGDGRSDLVGFSPRTGEWTVGANTGDAFDFTTWNTFATTDGWTTHLAGDVTGDGHDDVLSYHAPSGRWWLSRSTGDGFDHVRWARYRTAGGWGAHRVGDFTGDGAADLASYHPGNGTWWVTQQTDDGPRTEKWASFATREGWQVHLAGDVTGDGTTDLVSYHPRGVLWVSSSTGEGFDGSLGTKYGTGQGWDTHLLADATGDGRDDVLSYHPRNGSWWLASSHGHDFSTSRWTTFGTRTGWQTHLAGDVTGDGAADLASFHPRNGTWWVSTASGDGVATSEWADFSPSNGWRHLAGRWHDADRMAPASFHPRNTSWWVSRPSGTGFSTSQWGQVP